jgi:hypothetical protein
LPATDNLTAAAADDDDDGDDDGSLANFDTHTAAATLRRLQPTRASAPLPGPRAVGPK